MSGPALVLSMVDTGSGTRHLVAVEVVPLHRRRGRYPALCGVQVVRALVTAGSARDCPDCVRRAGGTAGRGGLRRVRSLRAVLTLLAWVRSARRGAHRGVT
jgi:hypothetical protein